MSEQQSRAFGRLLKAGLNSIATIEGKKGPDIDDEVGDLVGLAGTSLQRYRSGAVPTDHHFTNTLAEACVTRGMMGRPWLEKFLQAARFPRYEGQALIARLFPDTAAPARSPVARSNIPPPTYTRFIMRRAAYEAALAGLRSVLPLTLLVSLGGMGKSTLAQVIARNCLEGHVEPSFGAIVWVSDRDHPGTTNLSTFLDEVARVLDYPGVAALAFTEKRREVEGLLRHQAILLVLDNAETVRDAALLEWLSGLPAPSKALVTSRSAPPLSLAACVVELEPMEVDEALALITERVAHSPLRQVRGAAMQLAPLAEITGGNPKAIELAVSLAQRSRLDEVLASIQNASHHDLFADLFGQAWGQLDAAAQRVMMAVTLFPTSVAADALAYSADLPAAAAQRALEQLADLSLLDVERADLLDTPRYAAHPLVRAFANARLSERHGLEDVLHGRWLAWCVALAQRAGFCWDNLDRLDLLDADHLTVQAALEWAAANGQDRAALDLAEGVRYYYNVRGLWDERRLANYPLRATVARRLGDVSELVLALAQHAEVLSKQSTLTQAAALLAEAEAAADGATLSADATFELGHARGLLAYAGGDLAAAESYWRSLLPFAATLDAQKHVINRRWLATCLLDQDRLDEAAALYQASLIDAQAANDIRSVTGNSLKLAAIDLDRGNLDSAAAALDSCRAASERYQDRRRLAECHHLRARLFEARGDLEAARDAREAAADLFIRMGMRREAESLRGSGGAAETTSTNAWYHRT